MTDAERERLRQQWLQQAEAAFDILFEGQRQDQLATFEQRESLTSSLGRELANWLLEQHLADDPAARSAPDHVAHCPRCHGPGVRYDPAEQPPPRTLTGRSGEVTFRRERWRCPTCRVAFFPSGPASTVGHGGLQSRPAP